jgi:hypothetical protein
MGLGRAAGGRDRRDRHGLPKLRPRCLEEQTVAAGEEQRSAQE